MMEKRDLLFEDVDVRRVRNIFAEYTQNTDNIFVVCKKTFSYVKCFISFWIIISSEGRSTSSEAFYQIGVLKNFAKFTGKHLYRCLFPNFLFPKLH